jgi:hypothetical protein
MQCDAGLKNRSEVGAAFPQALSGLVEQPGCMNADDLLFLSLTLFQVFDNIVIVTVIDNSIAVKL